MPQPAMFTMSGQRLGLTTYYRTISVDNKPTTVIIGPSKSLSLTRLRESRFKCCASLEPRRALYWLSYLDSVVQSIAKVARILVPCLFLKLMIYLIILAKKCIHVL